MASIERFKLGFRSLGREATSDSSNLNSSDQTNILVPRAPEYDPPLPLFSHFFSLNFFYNRFFDPFCVRLEVAEIENPLLVSIIDLNGIRFVDCE